MRSILHRTTGSFWEFHKHSSEKIFFFFRGHVKLAGSTVNRIPSATSNKKSSKSTFCQGPRAMVKGKGISTASCLFSRVKQMEHTECRPNITASPSSMAKIAFQGLKPKCWGSDWCDCFAIHCLKAWKLLYKTVLLQADDECVQLQAKWSSQHPMMLWNRFIATVRRVCHPLFATDLWIRISYALSKGKFEAAIYKMPVDYTITITI